MTIDTIAALEERTRGSRNEEETQVMERALAELRMNYVDEVKKAAAAPAPATEEPPPPPPAELDAETPGAVPET